jgi:transposase
MKKLSIIGVDLAKRVFQIHAVDEQGEVVVKKRLQRSEVLGWFSKLEPCLVGMESCSTSTYWAREISSLGHQVKLMPPAYVKPYVRRQKNDQTDAAAICEAVSRPSMRFVTIKTPEQQAIQVLHRTRELLTVQLTQVTNALRAHLAEFGLVFPQGNTGLAGAIAAVREETCGGDLPFVARQALFSFVDQIGCLRQQRANLDKQLTAWHRANADSRRLATIPGIGVVTASAIIAAIGDGRHFRSSREFAAWIGLVPRQNSSGGKERLGRISKKGNTYLRSLLVIGATALLCGNYRKNPDGAWFANLLQRKPKRVATVALANKMARVAWAVLVKGEAYRSCAVANDVPVCIAEMAA